VSGSDLLVDPATDNKDNDNTPPADLGGVQSDVATMKQRYAALAGYAMTTPPTS